MPGRALTRIRREYDLAMYQVQLSFDAISSEVSAYWWNLYLIKRDELWRSDVDSNEGFDDWLGDFSVKPFGQSRAQYYAVMASIERFKRIGKSDDEVRELLGKRKVALEGDLKELFLDGGRGDLRPEVAERIAAGGESVGQFVDRIADLGPGEARSAVRTLLGEDKVYVIQDEVVESNGELLVNMVWESPEDGIVWRGTVRISGTALDTGPRLRNSPSGVLPDTVSRYIQKRLGIRS